MSCPVAEKTKEIRGEKREFEVMGMGRWRIKQGMNEKGIGE